MNIETNVAIEDKIKFDESILSESCFQVFLENNPFIEESQNFVDSIPNGMNRLVVAGMGGSFMGTRALYNSLGSDKQIEFWHTIDEYSLSQQIDSIDSSTYFLIVSKSGETVESLHIYHNIRMKLELLEIAAAERIAVITEDKNSTLKKIAEDSSYLCFDHPTDIGGRFTLLCPVTFIPCLWAGINITSLVEKLKNSFIANSAAAVQLANFIVQQEAKGKNIQVVWAYDDQATALTEWWQQLWAESLGKSNTKKGEKAPKLSIPFICKSSQDQHSVLQQFVENCEQAFFIFMASETNHLTYLQSLSNYEAMSQIEIPAMYIQEQIWDIDSLANYISMYFSALFMCAKHYDIDPYGQEGVELGKRILKAKLQQNTFY